MLAPPLHIEFLFTPGCPSAWAALRLLRRVLAEEYCEARVIVRVIKDEQALYTHPGKRHPPLPTRWERL